MSFWSPKQLYRVLSKEHMASLSPEQARVERYFRAMQAIALLSSLYACAVLWVPEASVPPSYRWFELRVYGLYGPSLFIALFIRAIRRPWVRNALSAILLTVALSCLRWILHAVSSGSVATVDDRVLGVYSRTTFAVVLALHLVRLFLAARLLIFLRKPSVAAYFGASLSSMTSASTTAGVPTMTPRGPVARSAEPESAEGKLLRRCLRAFVALSVPWATPCCYFSVLEIAESRRIGHMMDPTPIGIATAVIIYLLLGPVPLFIAILGSKRSPRMHRILSFMMWLCALLSVGYICAATHLLLTSRVSGNSGVETAVNDFLFRASMALVIVRLLSGAAVLVVLRRPGVRTLYGLSTPPKQF